tara:strand:+ start:60 stop:356 length:297 start_codon:yes stop_codon:yes gene_type:complete
MTVTIATLLVLVLYINDVPKEWMGHHENSAGKWVEMGMGGCLKMKRTLKRNGWKDSYTGKTRFVCEKHDVELGLNHEGLIVVKKILTFEKKKKEAVKI